MQEQKEIAQRASVSRTTHEITLTDPSPDEVLRRLIALYVGGVHGLVVSMTEPPSHQVQGAVERACRRLPGLQLLGLRSRAFVLEAEDTARPPDLYRTLSRMALRADRLLDRAIAAIEEAQEESFLLQVRSEEEHLDGLLHHLRRQVTLTAAAERDHGDHPGDMVHAVLVAEFLERVGDYAVQLIDSSETMGPQERAGVIGERLRRDLTTARELVRHSAKAVLTDDHEAAEKLIDRILAFSTKVRTDTFDMLDSPLKPGLLPTRRVYLGYVTMMEAIERISLYAKSIAEVALDQAAVHQIPSAGPPPDPEEG